MMDTHEFLTAKLRRRAAAKGQDIALGFLEDGCEITQSFTVEALETRVNDVAHVLVKALKATDRVLLLFPPGLDFVVAFLACLRAGRIAVPAIPPEPHKPARSLARLGHLVDDAGPAMVLCTAAVEPFRPILESSIPALAHLPWIDVSTVPHAHRSVEDPREDGLAFLQYTSGSTADPKGVRVMRRNLNHNLWVIHGVAPAKPEASVSWLPQFHDMGLIEGILLPLDGGWPAWLMPPWAFLQRPLVWLEAIQRFGAMRSGGPNFAYDLCYRKILPDARAMLDLSCWKQAYCGAEPIRSATLSAFSDAFAAAKFSAANWFPCYGLAEHTVLATCRTHEPHLVERISTNRLARGKAEPAKAWERAVDVVCVGEIPPAVTAIIVDSNAKPLPDGRVGEIYLQSESVADGYWQNEEATTEVFRATLHTPKTNRKSSDYFLRTGDLGYRRKNQLFIVGRRKDVLIVHGRNYHAHDVERTAESAHPSIRRGCVCAVMAPNDADANSPPVVVCEVDGRIDPEKRLEITNAVHRAVTFEHGIAVRVTLVGKHTIPKTSSGKLQRRATAHLVAQGAIDVPRQTFSATPSPDAFGDAVEMARIAICRVSGLAPNEIDAQLPPAQLPLDSLQTVDAITELSRSLSRSISISDWSDAPSLVALVEGSPAGAAPWEAHLDRDLPLFTRRKGPQTGAILVTGGTGLIGKALVEALNKAGRSVFILARGANGAGAIAGDITRHNFGLDEPRYRALAGEVGVVVHIAGAVNWVLPYGSLVTTNVHGTDEVLAFCAASGARMVHVSSQIVAHGQYDSPDVVVDDNEDADTLRARIADLPLGYAQSKAVSEWRVRKSRENGLEATIVRPGLIPAALDDAAPEDIISILVRTFIEAGAAPNVDWPFSICPLDHLVRVLVNLVNGGPPLVHVTDESRSSREIIAWLVVAGYDVQLVSWPQWLEKIETRGLHMCVPLRGLWPFIKSGALLDYARENRATIRMAKAFEVTERLDPAFIDERIRAWQKTGWLNKPLRPGVHATVASRAFPEPPRQVVVDGNLHDVLRAEVEPNIAGSGILSRLAAGFCNRPIGIFPAKLTLDDGRVLDVVLKASARGDELRALCTTVARVSNPALADALEQHGRWLDVGAADAREKALYRFTNGSLAKFIPFCHSTFHGADPDAPLVLERLRAGHQVEKLDAVNAPWPIEQVLQVALALGRMHAAYRERLDKLAEIPWARPLRTKAQMLLPLWEALFAHARTQIPVDIANLAARLLRDISWAHALTHIAPTLLHNDANPRNLAIRTGGTSGIVLYDWELSAIGPATRDLAEWLCFTLSPTESVDETVALLRAHATIALPGLNDRELLAAFQASLAWFFFDRLTTYTVVSPIFDLPWLGRVFETWHRLVTSLQYAPIK